jgi:hypothetical protein
VIVLAKANHLHLLKMLKNLADELILPDAVVAEVLAGPESDPARQALESGWARVHSPAAIPSELIEWGLGPGETAVLALALERTPSTAILDDAAARACAKAFGVSVLGTGKNTSSKSSSRTRFGRWASCYGGAASAEEDGQLSARPGPQHRMFVRLQPK